MCQESYSHESCPLQRMILYIRTTSRSHHLFGPPFQQLQLPPGLQELHNMGRRKDRLSYLAHITIQGVPYGQQEGSNRFHNIKCNVELYMARPKAPAKLMNKVTLITHQSTYGWPNPNQVLHVMISVGLKLLSLPTYLPKSESTSSSL